MKLFSTIQFLLLGAICLAQPSSPNADPTRDYTVKGFVLESGSDLALEFATISFIDIEDRVVTGGITDANGGYEIKVPGGVYAVRYEFISYTTVERKGIRGK